MSRHFRIKKGLDVPVAGEPKQAIEAGATVRRVGLVGDDYIGMRPTMAVQEGDRVQLGQVLFEDKKTPGVLYTSPGTGTVVAVNRGAKRRFESIVIELEGEEQVGFRSFPDHNLAQLGRDEVVENLVASGLWTALRRRPYSKVASPEMMPAALFVTAIDTNPLAADPAVVLEGQSRDFIAGLEVLCTLPSGPTYLCKRAGASIPGDDLKNVEVAEFSGPHPAGLPGTHIHMLAPVSMSRTVWYIGYQDVVSIGRLFLTGELLMDRVISIGGPAAINPRLVRTRLGANVSELVAEEQKPQLEFGPRVVSGSVLAGRKSQEPNDYLGRYHVQISLLPEGRERELLGWMAPGLNKFSIKPAFLSALTSDSGRRFAFTTSTHGSHRAIVPIGTYERVMPLDIIPTPLLKALLMDDTEIAQSLGCLELDEEDLGLCTFVCPGKNDYGPLLRDCLTRIELEG